MTRKKIIPSIKRLPITHREDNAFHALIVEDPNLSIEDQKLLSDLARTLKPFKARPTRLQGAKPKSLHTEKPSKKPEKKPKENFAVLLLESDLGTRKKPPAKEAPALPAAPIVTPPKRKALAPDTMPERLAREERRKLQRGLSALDATLDLHGLDQATALASLRSFIKNAYHQGLRMVLVITGKGLREKRGRLAGDGDHSLDIMGTNTPGVLRRKVPQWLALSDLRPLIVAISEAAPQHGGGGALYVQIRRRGVG